MADLEKPENPENPENPKLQNKWMPLKSRERLLGIPEPKEGEKKYRKYWRFSDPKNPEKPRVFSSRNKTFHAVLTNDSFRLFRNQTREAEFLFRKLCGLVLKEIAFYAIHEKQGRQPDKHKRPEDEEAVLVDPAAHIANTLFIQDRYPVTKAQMIEGGKLARTPKSLERYILPYWKGVDSLVRSMSVSNRWKFPRLNVKLEEAIASRNLYSQTALFTLAKVHGLFISALKGGRLPTETEMEQIPGGLWVMRIKPEAGVLQRQVDITGETKEEARFVLDLEHTEKEGSSWRHFSFDLEGVGELSGFFNYALNNWRLPKATMVRGFWLWHDPNISRFYSRNGKCVGPLLLTVEWLRREWAVEEGKVKTVEGFFVNHP